MYLGMFRHWRTLLADGARLVVIFPRVTSRSGRTYHLDSLLDKLSALGYTRTSSELIYARPGAIVERDVIVFSYQEGK